MPATTRSCWLNLATAVAARRISSRSLSLVRHADDPQPIIAEGEWDGEILSAGRGDDGFGYDPLFYIRELDKTAAELDAAEKNRRSHRGQALARLVERLQARR
jgi:XTP/dITP diphosphohydrolase